MSNNRSGFDPASLYQQVGRLIETMPLLTVGGELTPDIHRWLGRAAALVEESGDLQAKTDWGLANIQLLTDDQWTAARTVQLTLYRILGIAELQAPAGVKGSFIPVGAGFDALSAVGKVLQSATKDIFIVDPYMDETVLTDFAPTAPESGPPSAHERSGDEQAGLTVGVDSLDRSARGQATP
jgi:hypothetical protein